MILRSKIAAFILLVSPSLSATEIDSFTLRAPAMADALFEINRIMNRDLNETIEELNYLGVCDNNLFRTTFKDRVGGLFWANIEEEIEKDPLIDVRNIHIRDSIYRDFTLFESYALYIANLGGLIKVGDFYVGTDKIGHFVEQGYDYFSILHLNNGTFEEALEYGEASERGRYGLATTGIYSHGDLTANYEGLRFWERLLARPTQETKPYVSCENGVYRLNEPFDWSEYINAAWDEGINCNRYKTPVMEEKVNRRIAELEKLRGVKLSCPIASEQCREIIEHYGVLAPRLITSTCF